LVKRTVAGLLDDPGTLAVDASGNLHVADLSDGRIQKFDPSGKFMFLWNVGADSYIASLTA
jgi:hypothetical protein